MIEKNIRSINLCYTQASEKESNLKGELVFTLLVDSKGRVIKANTNSGKNKIAEIERCIIQKLRKLDFPAPEGSKSVTVTITFILK